MYKLDKGDKDAIRLTRATIGPHSAEVLKKMLIKEGNAKLEMDRRTEMLMSGSQAAEDIILAEDAMELLADDSMQEEKMG